MKTPRCSHRVLGGLKLDTEQACSHKATQRIVTSSRIVFRCEDHKQPEADNVFDLTAEAS